MAYKSGFSRQRARHRRRLFGRAALWLAGLGIFVALGYASYSSGTMLARLETRKLEDDIVRLNGQLDGTRIDNERLRADLAQARLAADGVKRRYDADVPAGALAALVATLRERLSAGIREERMSQLLKDAENTRPCEGRFTRKRFAIRAPGQPEDSVSLLDGLIQVSASSPATADDPAKTATVAVSRVWAAQPVKATGLPARFSLPLNNAELKLVVEPSDLRGYATVTLSLCGKG